MMAPVFGFPIFRRQDRLDDISQDVHRPQEGTLRRQTCFRRSRDKESNGTPLPQDGDRLASPLHLVESRLSRLGSAHRPHALTLENPQDLVNAGSISLFPFAR